MSARRNWLLAAFADMRLAVKIVCLVGLLGIIAIVISLYAQRSMRDIDKGYRGLIATEAQAALRISDTSLVLREASRLVYAVLTEQNAQSMLSRQDTLQDMEDQFDAQLRLVRDLLPHKVAALDDIAGQARQLFLFAHAVVKDAARWRGDRALQIIHNQFEPVLHRLQASMDGLRGASIDAFQDTAEQLSDTTRHTILATSLGFGIGLILVLTLSVYLTITQISRPIAALTRTMRRLTDRVYDDDIQGTERRDEVGTMAQAMQVFRDTMLHADRLSEQVRESDQARRISEQIAQEKAAFLAIMSHEIRTPLNAMLGMAQLVLKSELPKPQRERMHALLRATRHLQSIVNDILDLSKIDHGKLQIESTDFELQQVLADVMEMMQSRAAAKGLGLFMRVAPDVPAMLVGDPTRIRQILLNYVGNAIKFTDAGQIEVTVSVRPGDDGHGLMLHCQVRDSGIGMDAAQTGRLFQAFQQADVSITRRFGGTGLGLAISRRLAELMGGATGVTSAPGQGSTFWFTAQVRRSRYAQPPMNAQQIGAIRQDDSAGDLLTSALALPPVFDTRALHGLRVLVVDDNPLNRVVATGLLEAGGLLADVAVDGQTAVETLEAAQDGTYALVLMDMQMPVMDGLAATRRLRASPRFADLPIVAMTANASAQDREATAQVGMNAHIAKPVDEMLMWQTLSRVLSAPGAPVPAAAASLPSSEPAHAGPATDASADPSGSRRSAASGQAAPAHGADGAAAPDMPLGEVLNLAPLQDLRQRFSTARFQSLLRLFANDALSRARRIEAAAQRGDIESLRRNAHDLVSTAGNFGLLSLSSLGRSLRAAALAGDGVQARALAVRIHQATQNGLQALQRGFPEAGNLLTAQGDDDARSDA